ncbi:hypothetical protein IPL85_00895 [Candidatus Saccharibacteria bacterium]|nr:MAG: hypothetical protein IPL85_00895 [Candidatus Saccharibacteria bacterium]
MILQRQLFAKKIPLLTKFFLFVSVVLLAYVVIAQTILIPRAISMQYDHHLKPAFKLLSAKFNAVSASSGLPAYNDPYTDGQAARKELLATQKLIAETEVSLLNYQQQADKLPGSPLATHSESYKKAEVIRTRAKYVMLQSSEVLSGYKELTAYLLDVNTARTVLKNSATDINDLTDLTRLAGQGDVIAKRATQLSGTLDALKKTHAPTGFAEYHAALIVSFEQGLFGLTEISNGLYASDDSQVNAGAGFLEQAILKIESSDNALFTTAANRSVTLNETSELADKIDSLQPFLGQ